MSQDPPCPVPLPCCGTYSVHVLGCKVNQVEARQIEQFLSHAGLHPCPKRDIPDVLVVHTCAVTAEAEVQSAQTLRRVRAGAPHAHLILSGCGAARLLSFVPADTVIPSGPEWADAWFRTLSLSPEAVPRATLSATDPILRQFGGRVRAFLKIQDGCDLNCSYCIVPSLRGPSRDRPVSKIIEEAKSLIADGCRELVVTGVSAGLYGRHNGGTTLSELLRRLANLPDLERLRLSSLHPAELTLDILNVWQEMREKIMPHVHLPLQSGSDRILKRMRRGYTVKSYREAVDRVRKVLPEPEFNTDLIAGFPGETDEDAKKSEEMCRQIGFSRIHVFPYSVRPNTDAASLPDPVPVALARKRARQLRDLASQLALRSHHREVGRTVRVYVESQNAKTLFLAGYTERYLPVQFPGPTNWIGSTRVIRILEADSKQLRGHPAEVEASNP